MPLYDYKCADCGKLTEIRHGFDESHDDPCPACGGTLKRVFSAAPIVFKGSGFYVTDSRSKSAGAGGSSAASPAKAEPAAAEPKSTEPAKTESPKSEAPAPAKAAPAAGEPAA